MILSLYNKFSRIPFSKHLFYFIIRLWCSSLLRECTCLSSIFYKCRAYVTSYVFLYHCNTSSYFPFWRSFEYIHFSSFPLMFLLRKLKYLKFSFPETFFFPHMGINYYLILVCVRAHSCFTIYRVFIIYLIIIIFFVKCIFK